MKSEDRERMLALIKQRLDETPVEEVLEQLHAGNGGGGPTCAEFIESFDLPDANPDFLEDPVVENEADRAAAKRFLACCAGEDAWVPSEQRLLRLVKIGWLEHLPTGAWAATPALRVALNAAESA